MANIFQNINQVIRSGFRRWLFNEDYMDLPSMHASEEDRKHYSLILTARDYYDGNHTMYLTDRQKAWLDLHSEAGLKFVVNHCATVIDTTLERLQVLGFSIEGDDDELESLVQGWWDAEKLEQFQADIFRHAIIDGEHFVMVDWNQEEERPVFIRHNRFIARDAGGNGAGVWIEYPNDRVDQDPIRALKRWDEPFLNEYGRTDIRKRMNVYYPSYIEKYFLKNGRWEPFVDALDESGAEIWPTPWVDGAGKPIGIPFVHFRTPSVNSDLKMVIPLQDSLNKTWLDMMAAADSTAFRMLVTFGWFPTSDGKEPASDGSNALHIAPGQIFGTKKSPQEASLEPIEPANINALLEIESRIIQRMAEVSRTPSTRFSTSKMVAGAETLKEQESPLIAKVQERQVIFGNAFEQMMILAFNQARAFSSLTAQIGPSDIAVNWRNPASRHEDTEIKLATSKQSLHVPLTTIWKELGYSQEQVNDMVESPEYTAYLASLQMLLAASENVDGDPDDPAADSQGDLQ